MDLVVNGERYDHQGEGSIPELLQECRAEPARTAVMVNEQVIPRSRWDTVRLSEGDHVELLMMTAGG